MPIAQYQKRDRAFSTTVCPGDPSGEKARSAAGFIRHGGPVIVSRIHRSTDRITPCAPNKKRPRLTTEQPHQSGRCFLRTNTTLRIAYYSYRDEYTLLNPGGRQPLLAQTKQTEYCLGPLSFSEPTRLTINAVGVGFIQLTQLAVSALFSRAEKVLGIVLTP
jgi:hypothetical protein